MFLKQFKLRKRSAQLGCSNGFSCWAWPSNPYSPWSASLVVSSSFPLACGPLCSQRLLLNAWRMLSNQDHYVASQFLSKLNTTPWFWFVFLLCSLALNYRFLLASELDTCITMVCSQDWNWDQVLQPNMRTSSHSSSSRQRCTSSRLDRVWEVKSCLLSVNKPPNQVNQSQTQSTTSDQQLLQT